MTAQPQPRATLEDLIDTLNRVAQALEQHTLAVIYDERGQADVSDLPPLVESYDSGSLGAPVPLPVQPPVQVQSPVERAQGCPVHRVPWRWVPAGYSQKKQKAYDAFQACPERGCNEKPR